MEAALVARIIALLAEQNKREACFNVEVAGLFDMECRPGCDCRSVLVHC